MGLRIKLPKLKEPEALTEYEVTSGISGSSGTSNPKIEYDSYTGTFKTSTGSSGYINPNHAPAPIPMNEEMTERLWTLINENTELRQKLTMTEHKLVQIKRLMEE